MENKCCECGYNDDIFMIEPLYKYEDKVYCFDHLMDVLEAQRKVIVQTYDIYFKEDYKGVYGDNSNSETDMKTIIDNICNDLKIEKLEEK